MSSSSDNNSESDHEENSVDDSESESEEEDDFDTRLENFTKSLEDSLKEAQKYNLKVPEQDLSSLRKKLCAHFSLDSKNLQVKAAFEAAKQINESFVGFKTLTFLTSNCVSERGRYSNFDRGTYLKRIRCLTDYDCIPGNIKIVLNIKIVPKFFRIQTCCCKFWVGIQNDKRHFSEYKEQSSKHFYVKNVE